MMDFFNMPQGVRRSMVGFTPVTAGSRAATVVIASPREMPRAWLDRWDPRTNQSAGTIAVHHVNVPGGRDAFSLFTPRYGRSLACTPDGLYLAAAPLVGARHAGQPPVYVVTGRLAPRGGGGGVPPRGGGVAEGGDARAYAPRLPIGAVIQPRWTLPEEWRKRGVTHGLLAGPRLLAEGRPHVTAAQERLDRLRSRDRMALGVCANGDVLLAWLHRDLGSLSFEEAADVLKRLGAREAIALDGGSSRSMVAVAQEDYRRERYVESGRPVSNAVVITQLPGNRS
jgi:hypothetical protein